MTSASDPIISVIVPARNEEACLEACLRSLTQQKDLSYELLVVDDASTDRTPEIARIFAEVTLLPADPLTTGWSGKSNACFTGAKHARGAWLLFTDADTVHDPQSLSSALNEAREHEADMLSYSPRQEVVTIWEKLVMPLVFAELAATYNTDDINQSASPRAAANGQFILISRAVYGAIGGHAAVAHTILEDVALAQSVKAAGYKLRFRYEDKLVRTRMYRSFRQMAEGWSKVLFLLFPGTAKLAAFRCIEFFAGLAGFLLAATFLAQGKPTTSAVALAVTLIFYFNFLRRVRRAHFDLLPTSISFFGLPIFAFLLVRSLIQSKSGFVSWKGRSYATSPLPTPESSSPTSSVAMREQTP